MSPKLLFPVWLFNLVMVAGLSDSAALLAIGFIIGQGVTLLLILHFRKSERAMLKQWTDALLEKGREVQAIHETNLRRALDKPRDTPEGRIA